MNTGRNRVQRVRHPPFKLHREGAMLQDITTLLESAETESSPIAESKIRGWMSSDDAEVLGATHTLLTQERLVRRITPPLPFDEVFAFFLRYYEFTLKSNLHGEWVDDRFTAGCDFVSFFVLSWDEGRDKRYLSELKSLLARIYVDGPPELKISIEQAIVEHLFERDDIQTFFSDWRDNPRLRSAYDAGLSWVQAGGKSPLTERNRFKA